LKVVQVVLNFPLEIDSVAAVGGGYRHVYFLIRELSKQGVKIEVLAAEDKHFSAEVKKKRVFDTVDVYCFPCFPIPFAFYPMAPSMPVALMLRDADIIHAHAYAYFTSDVSAIVCKLRNRPFVLTIHGFFQPSRSVMAFLMNNIYDKSLGELTLKTATRVIAPSRFIARECIRKGVDPKKMSVIPNGVDLEEFRDMPTPQNFKERYGLEQSRVILAMGRLSKTKGFQHLIRATPKIIRAIPKAKIVIVGPDLGYGHELRRLAKELNVEKHMIFAGALTRYALKEALAAADIFTCPSIYEPFGIVILEAMAAGKPIVASRTGGIVDIINDGETGLLVKNRDANQLAQAIIKLLKHEKLAETLSKNSKSDVKNYSWKVVAEKTKSTYEKVLNEFC